MALPNLNENNENKKGLELPSFDMPSIEDEYIELDYDTPEFEEIPVDDVMNYEDDILENEEIYQEANTPMRKQLPNDYPEEEVYYDTEEDYNPDFEDDEKLEQKRKHKFVDKKNKKVIPLGGKKSKRKVKSSEFDDRKNTLATTKILRLVIMIIISGLFIFGLKNTFFPSHVYTENQIRSFAQAGAGQTGFPQERGTAFVESFMEAYLTFDREKPELNEILNYYYGEDNFASLSPQQLRIDKGINAKQHIIIAPQVYEADLLTEYSALYKVSTFVSNTDNEESIGNRSAGRWVSFAINVYYDKETEGMAITKDSPSVIPTYRILKQTSVPTESTIGNGKVNTEILPALTPTINEFVKAYAEASIASHESILQYIDDKQDINLYDGFGGSVTLDGSPSQAIQKTVYDSDDGLYRVDLNITWVDNVASTDDKKIEYISRYIMRIKPIGDGKYLVTSFKPFSYIAQ